jgi:hypothetical protein
MMESGREAKSDLELPAILIGSGTPNQLVYALVKGMSDAKCLTINAEWNSGFAKLIAIRKKCS